MKKEPKLTKDQRKEKNITVEDVKRKSMKVIEDLAEQLNIRSKMEGEARMKLTGDLNSLFTKVGSSLNGLDLKLKSLDIALTTILELLMEKGQLTADEFRDRAEVVYQRVNKQEEKKEENTTETKKD